MRFNKLWERQTRFPITYAGAFWTQMRVPCTTSPIDICWDLHTSSSVWRAATVFVALYTRAPPPLQPIAPRPGAADVLFKALRKAPPTAVADDDFNPWPKIAGTTANVVVDSVTRGVYIVTPWNLRFCFSRVFRFVSPPSPLPSCSRHPGHGTRTASMIYDTYTPLRYHRGGRPALRPPPYRFCPRLLHNSILEKARDAADYARLRRRGYGCRPVFVRTNAFRVKHVIPGEISPATDTRASGFAFVVKRVNLNNVRHRPSDVPCVLLKRHAYKSRNSSHVTGPGSCTIWYTARVAVRFIPRPVRTYSERVVLLMCFSTDRLCSAHESQWH